MRLIDADALEELFREVIGCIAKKPEMTGAFEHMVRASAMVIEMINDAPTIEDLSGFCDRLWRGAYERGKEERGTGKWHQSYDSGSRMYECSACGGRMIADPYDLAVGEKGYGFCPYCGADMIGEHDELDR